MDPDQFKQQRSRNHGLPLCRRRQRTTDHHFDQLFLRRFGSSNRTDQSSLPQHADRIGDRQHFAQFMADIQDRFSLPTHTAQQFQQLRRLAGRQHRGRFVKNQDVAAPIQQFDDFHPLSQADWQRLHRSVQVERQP